MSVMGYRDTIELGNMMNSRIAGANRNIAYNNSIERSNFKANLQAEKGNLEGLEEKKTITEGEERGKEGTALGKSISDVGDMTRKGIAKYKEGRDTLAAAGRALGAVGGEVRPNGDVESFGQFASRVYNRPSTIFDREVDTDPRPEVAPGGEGEADVDAVQDLGRRLDAGEGPRAPVVPDGGAPEVPDAPRINTDDVPDVAEGAQGLGKVGKVLAGVGALEGAYDLYEDATAKTGTWGKKKGYEKVEDVANITGGVAGALELAGVGLDATLVGAPIGLAVGALGAVAGAVSFGADLYGDTKTDAANQSAIDTEKKTISSLKNQGAPQESQIADRVLGTTGAYVGGA